MRPLLASPRRSTRYCRWQLALMPLLISRIVPSAMVGEASRNTRDLRRSMENPSISCVKDMAQCVVPDLCHVPRCTVSTHAPAREAEAESDARGMARQAKKVGNGGFRGKIYLTRRYRSPLLDRDRGGFTEAEHPLRHPVRTHRIQPGGDRRFAGSSLTTVRLPSDCRPFVAAPRPCESVHPGV